MPLTTVATATTAVTELQPFQPMVATSVMPTKKEQVRDTLYKQPQGFRELRERISKFAGDGRKNFDVWLADYCEATGDCGWSDELRAWWFSWFLTGSAKYTWQWTLGKEDKSNWNNIVQVYKGHYGVHMGPRTAYLHCNELQYSDFTSVQGLLEVMKDYQRMAPDQLSN